MNVSANLILHTLSDGYDSSSAEEDDNLPTPAPMSGDISGQGWDDLAIDRCLNLALDSHELQKINVPSNNKENTMDPNYNDNQWEEERFTFQPVITTRKDAQTHAFIPISNDRNTEPTTDQHVDVGQEVVATKTTMANEAGTDINGQTKIDQMKDKRHEKEGNVEMKETKEWKPTDLKLPQWAME